MSVVDCWADYLSFAEVQSEAEEAESNYPDDFEEEEEEEEFEDENSLGSQSACEAGGLSIVLKSQNEVCNQQSPEQTEEGDICRHGPWKIWKVKVHQFSLHARHPVLKSCSK